MTGTEGTAENVPGPVAKAMALRTRVCVAVVVAVLAGTYTYFHLLDWGVGAADFSWPLRGAQRLISGLNPYDDPTLGPENPYPSNYRLSYPMPALLLALPFAWLPPELAGAAFFGLSSGLLAFALSRMGWGPLLTLASQPFWYAAGLAQWSPLLIAATLLPWLYPVLLAKPNLGAAVAVSFPSVRGYILSVLLLLISVAVYPTWIGSWLGGGTAGGVHFPPVLLLPGTLLLLALIHWRLPTARLLTVLALAPQTLSFSDQLMLFLIPRTTRQFAYLVVTSWISFGGWMLTRLILEQGVFFRSAAFWVLVFYVSALALVLAQGHGYASAGNLERVTVPHLPSPLNRWIWWWNARLAR